MVLVPLLASVTATSASATTYDVRLCQKVTTGTYTDEAVGDFWVNSNYDRAARGFDVWVADRLTGATIWTGQLYASGPNVGCTPVLQLDDQVYHMVQIDSYAAIHGNLIVSMDNNMDQDMATSYYYFTPNQDETLNMPALPGDTDPRWRHLALAAFAVQRFNAQLSGEWMHLYAQNCPLPQTSMCMQNGEVYLSNGTAKTTAGHELGHLLSSLVSGGLNKDYSARENACDGSGGGPAPAGHAYLTKEFQSAAAVEGIANFYSAITWNQVGSGADCAYTRSGPLDFDLNGTADVTSWTAHSCSGDPYDPPPGSSGVDPGSADWLEEMVVGGACNSPLENRSTEFDWLRYFWAMTSSSGVPVSKIWDAWDAADPDVWCASDDTSSGCTLPIDAWEVAVDAQHANIPAAHNANKHHGLDH